jgi:seryl-tRNA synthetase
MNNKFVIEKSDYVKMNQKNRFLDETVVDDIIHHSKDYKYARFNYDNMQKNSNKIKKYIKKCTGVINTDLEKLVLIKDLIHQETFDMNNLIHLTKHDIIELSKLISKEKDVYEIKYKKLEKDRDRLLLSLGNKLHRDVPIYKSESENIILRKYTGFNIQVENPKIHYDLCEEYNIVDYKKGIDVSGNRGYFLSHLGVKLNRALFNYALDFTEKYGYKFMQTPHFIKTDQIKNVSQLSEFTETLYKLEGYDQYLIATSEQPLTAYFQNTSIKQTDLPLQLAGISTCYRKEVGAHAKDTRGIFRVHQFEKLEQFCVTKPENSWEMFHKMINISEEFYKSLGFSYRVINIVSGALNKSASMKYDIEAFFPGSNNFKELVSCSNCLDYFSQRISCKDDKKNNLHMLNATLFANTRTICCLLETYQTNDGIIIPEVLQPYLNMKKILKN